MHKHLLVGIVVLLLLPTVAALSISPPSQTYETSDGLEEAFDFRITSSSDVEENISINVTGELQEYITVESNSIVLEPNERRTLSVNISIPDDVEMNGRKTGNIRVRSLSTEGSGMITIQTELVASIDVIYPYPGKFVDITQVEIDSPEQGNNASLTYTLKSRGDEQVEVTPSFSIMDRDRNQVKDLALPSHQLQPSETITETVSLETDELQAGDYLGDFQINFEDGSQTERVSFLVGERDIDLLSFYPETFEAGTVSPVKVGVKNTWTQDLSDIYAEIRVGDNTMTTPTLDELEAENDHMFQHYLDTNGVEPGEYEATVDLYFENSSSTHTRTIEVKEQVQGAPTTTSSWNNTYGIVVLLIVAIGYMLYSVRRRQDDESE